MKVAEKNTGGGSHYMATADNRLDARRRRCKIGVDDGPFNANGNICCPSGKSRNNLILGSNSGTNTYCYGLFIDGGSPIIRNNSIIVVSTCASAFNYGAYLTTNSHASLQNNLFEILDSAIYTSYSI
jgi:hypothetical protein